MNLVLNNETLPIYLDGGDGSLWPARDAWEIMLSEEVADVSTRRFVRVSELLALLRRHGIDLTYEEVVNSSNGGATIITQP